MACSANYAWNNRQCIMHLVPADLHAVFWMPQKTELGLELVYDVAHNIGKFEKTHRLTAKNVNSLSTAKVPRAHSPAGHPEIPDKYQKVGQPVLIPGDMGTASYVLVGQSGCDGGDMGHHLPTVRGESSHGGRRLP